jgi:hypothetical protein
LSSGVVGLGVVLVLLPAGLVVLLPLFAVLVAVTSPNALRVCRRGLGSLPRPTPDQLDALARSMAYASPMYVPFELPFDLRLLTDDELRSAWVDSEAALRRPPSPGALLAAVEERGRYLNELARRQPGLLGAWLASDAGAPDGSLPFAPGCRLESTQIDWDQLTGGQATER